MRTAPALLIPAGRQSFFLIATRGRPRYSARSVAGSLALTQVETRRPYRQSKRTETGEPTPRLRSGL